MNNAVLLKYGNTNCYLVGKLLIDTDIPGTINELFRVLKRNNIPFSDIDYVIATHYHPDHIGLIGELTAMGVKLIIVENQINYVHFSDSILMKQFSNSFVPLNEKAATIVPIKESRQFLKSIGLDGEIITTNSHSNDSIAIILDDGDCFTGDLEPHQFIDAYQDNDKLKDDWNSILSHHPKLIYYGHRPCELSFL